VVRRIETVAVQTLLTADLTDEALALLRANVDLTLGGVVLHRRLLSPEELVAELEGKEALIVSYEQITAEVMDACPRLKLIASIRGGPEANVSIDAATERGIPVIYTVGRTEKAVSEYTFALMLAIGRNLAIGDRLVRGRVLTSDAPQTYARDVVWRLPEGTEAAKIRAGLTGVELYQKNLGLVGLGNIGQAVARLAKAFGMRVLAYDPYLQPERAAELGVELVDLPDVLRQADFVSLHARVTPESTGVIGREQFRLMKPTSYLICTARAALMDEDALIEALREKWIAGAALDVFHKEPLDSHYPLLDFDNVITTPHLAGSSKEIPLHHSRMVAGDVVSYLRGVIPTGHVKNPEVFDHPEFRRRGGLLLGRGTGS
jgi:D-3-phosphoglycerate dehydrogenase / 2-oxoglutarate reductase